jgi:hypothetical protein
MKDISLNVVKKMKIKRLIIISIKSIINSI